MPTELRHGSPRVLAYDEDAQAERRIDDINFLEECGAEPPYDLLDTSKGSAAIMIAISVHGYWNPETWFSARSRSLIT